MQYFPGEARFAVSLGDLLQCVLVFQTFPCSQCQPHSDYYIPKEGNERIGPTEVAIEELNSTLKKKKKKGSEKKIKERGGKNRRNQLNL